MTAVSHAHRDYYSGKIETPPASKVALEYLKTFSGIKNLVSKPSSVVFDAISLYDPSYRDITNFTNDAKNYSEAGGLPGAICDWNTKFWQYLDKRSQDTLHNLVKKTADLIVNFADVAKAVSSRFTPLGSAMTAIGFAGSVSVVISLGYYGIQEEREKIQNVSEKLTSEGLNQEEKAQKAVAEAQIRNSYYVIARNVHYTALAAIAATAKLFQFTAPAPLMVALAAGGLFFSIISHFDAEMYLKTENERLKAAQINFV